MPSISLLLEQISETAMAQQVGQRHEDARSAYPLGSNQVNDYRDFEQAIGAYLAYHLGRCVTAGGRLSMVDACGMAKSILEQYARRHGRAGEDFFLDARDGTNRGLRAALDAIAEHLQQEAAERYIRSVLDMHVAPSSWLQKVELIRQIIAQYGGLLGAAIDAQHPERYAHDYEPLVRELSRTRTRIMQEFRRR